MLRFYPASLVTSMLWLSTPADYYGMGRLTEEEFREDIRKYLREFRKDADRCKLQNIVDQIDAILNRWLTPGKEAPVNVLTALVSQLVGATQAELKAHLYFRIPKEERTFYENPPLNKVVADAFPSAFRDLQAAGRCFALDESTACVLHLMRALEYPLAALAQTLGVAVTNPNWHTVLTDCENKISAIAPPAINWKDDKEFYSEAALNFRFFKDAWRNHASHGRHTYDKREAFEIMTHVASFIKHLSKRLKE